MKLTNRNIHRDVAYFYVGLLIAFSFSGIILNHRRDWYPMDYTYESKQVNIILPEDVTAVDDDYLKKATLDWKVENEFDSFSFHHPIPKTYYSFLEKHITYSPGI